MLSYVCAPTLAILWDATAASMEIAAKGPKAS
jgi:hypothetical protein